MNPTPEGTQTQAERPPGRIPTKGSASGPARVPLAVVAGNLRAIEAIHGFVSGASPLLCLTGSPGWGKSALAEYCSCLSGGNRVGGSGVLAASDWLNLPERAEAHGPLVLDNVEDAWSNLRNRHRLRMRLERRVRLRRPTLLVGNVRPGHGDWAKQVPEASQWAVVDIKPPRRGDRKTIVEAIALRERIVVSEEVARLFAAQMHGNGRSIQGALQRLGLVKSDWSRPDDIFGACGILMPYLIGQNGWDPRDIVFESAVKALCGTGSHKCCPRRLSNYILIRLMRLSEGSVAAFHGVSARQVYADVREVESRLEDPALVSALESAKVLARSSLDEC